MKKEKEKEKAYFLTLLQVILIPVYWFSYHFATIAVPTWKLWLGHDSSKSREVHISCHFKF